MYLQSQVKDTHQAKAKHHQRQAEVQAKISVATPWRDGNTLERQNLIMPVGIKEGYTNETILGGKLKSENRIFQDQTLALKIPKLLKSGILAEWPKTEN